MKTVNVPLPGKLGIEVDNYVKMDGLPTKQN